MEPRPRTLPQLSCTVGASLHHFLERWVATRGHATANLGSIPHPIKESWTNRYGLLRYIEITIDDQPLVILMMVNVWKEAENLSQDRDNALYDQIDSDNKMNTESFDDAMAALTFTAMAVTIALGFLFHL